MGYGAFSLSVSEPNGSPTEAQSCPRCSQENAPIAIYCVKCGAILPNEQLAGLDRILAEPDFIKRLINSESFKDALRKALGE
jgi:hypothetical protein